MPQADRTLRYQKQLHLTPYSHGLYKWCATMARSVVGSPIRRYFTDLRGAVTWLETIRERWQANTLQGNVPLGGVHRDSFRMTWQSRDGRSRKTRHLSSETASTTFRSTTGSNAWTPKRRAHQSATLRRKRAFHSVNQLQQQKLPRGRATTSQILAGAYIPAAPMPGNNIDTAAASGSTSAIAETPAVTSGSECTNTPQNGTSVSPVG